MRRSRDRLRLGSAVSRQDLRALLGPPLSPAAAVTLAALTPPASPQDLLTAPIDSNSAYVLEVAQYAFWTGDSIFLLKSLPAVRSALTFMLHARDKAGLPRVASMPTPQPGSLTLYLAALKADNGWPKWPGMLYWQPAAMKHCMDRLRRRQRSCSPSVWPQYAVMRPRLACRVWRRTYWNGQCYGTAEPGQAGRSTGEPDQLLGQWMAYQLDLGALLPADHLAQALRTVEARVGIGEQKSAALLPGWEPLPSPWQSVHSPSARNRPTLASPCCAAWMSGVTTRFALPGYSRSDCPIAPAHSSPF